MKRAAQFRSLYSSSPGEIVLFLVVGHSSDFSALFTATFLYKLKGGSSSRLKSGIELSSIDPKNDYIV